MNVLFVSPGQDTAGCGIAMKRAFDACAPDWSARAICRRPSAWGYAPDILWRHDDRMMGRRIRDLFRSADVIHAMEDPSVFRWFPNRAVRVVHHLGTFYRKDPDGVSAACRAAGAAELVDMHDLLLRPGLRWQPTPQDLSGLAVIREREWHPSELVRIAHAPTDRAIKGTERILAVVDRLMQRYPIDLDLIEKEPNAECLRRKARADVLIDALSIGPAVNALESMAMGVPVICGLERLTSGTSEELRDAMLADWGDLPFLEATADTLEAVVVSLLDPAVRAEWGRRGCEHAWRYHSPAAVVDRLKGLYGGLTRA